MIISKSKQKTFECYLKINYVGKDYILLFKVHIALLWPPISARVYFSKIFCDSLFTFSSSVYIKDARNQFIIFQNFLSVVYIKKT